MRYSPTLQRIRKRPPAPAATTLFIPGGGIGLDIGGVLHQLEMRELLKGTGTRGRV